MVTRVIKDLYKGRKFIHPKTKQQFILLFYFIYYLNYRCFVDLFVYVRSCIMTRKLITRIVRIF